MFINAMFFIGTSSLKIYLSAVEINLKYRILDGQYEHSQHRGELCVEQWTTYVRKLFKISSMIGLLISGHWECLLLSSRQAVLHFIINSDNFSTKIFVQSILTTLNIYLRKLSILLVDYCRKIQLTGWNYKMHFSILSSSTMRTIIEGIKTKWLIECFICK